MQQGDDANKGDASDIAPGDNAAQRGAVPMNTPANTKREKPRANPRGSDDSSR